MGSHQQVFFSRLIKVNNYNLETKVCSENSAFRGCFLSVFTGVQWFPLVVPPVVELGVKGPALLLPEAPPRGGTFLHTWPPVNAPFTVCWTNKLFLSVYLCRDGFLRASPTFAFTVTHTVMPGRHHRRHRLQPSANHKACLLNQDVK